ncbi:hypothetical protein ACF09E_01550 [Streptomyces sp. NPDC014891]|uniref:hypothetical protein n=1 Tax=Streptomyces sp. NPDC014891 TaxID=3364929 RepID=UPI0036F8EC99
MAPAPAPQPAPVRRERDLLGYTAATAIAREALATGRGVVALTLEKGVLPADRLAELLTPERLTGAPGPARA